MIAAKALVLIVVVAVSAARFAPPHQGQSFAAVSHQDKEEVKVVTGGDEHHKHIDYHAHPKYHFKYGVEDHHTGDHKTHQEERDGDVVKGEYTVVQPDGTIRTVKYTADDHSGFKAIVSTSGHAVQQHDDGSLGKNAAGGQQHQQQYQQQHEEVEQEHHQVQYHHQPQEQQHISMQEEDHQQYYHQ